MKIGFLQYSVIWSSPEQNFNCIRNALADCRCDLLVLPELFTCGYLFDSPCQIKEFAEPLNQSRTVDFLQSVAEKIGGTVTGTLPEDDNGILYNTAIAVNAAGLIGFQRKMHLPEYEKQFFQPGTDITPIDLPCHVRIGMMSCFDCWFPQFGSILKQRKVQIFCHSASFGGEVTPGILPVRALENQVFVVSCNRTGSELYAGSPEKFCGRSQIISPDGKILARAGDEPELAVVDIELDETTHPAFGSLICRDFPAEHNRYQVTIKEGKNDEFPLN